MSNALAYITKPRYINSIVRQSLVPDRTDADVFKQTRLEVLLNLDYGEANMIKLPSFATNA